MPDWPTPSPSHDFATVAIKTYRLFLAVPRHPAPQGAVLYLLDGNAAFAALDWHWLAARPQLSLVGIGYPDTEDFDFDRRSRDYTPPPPKDWDGGTRQALRRPHGGAKIFLERLSADILPQIEALLPAPPARRALWGHSYGGLFCLFALINGLKGFDSLHVASPSLWWGGDMIEAALAEFIPGPTAVARLALSHGQGEISSTGQIMVPPARLERLAGQVRHLAYSRDSGTGAKLPVKMACTLSRFPHRSHSQLFNLSLRHAIFAQDG